MLGAITVACLCLFLSGCGRSQLGSPDGDPPPDGGPPPSCAGDDDCDDGDPCNGEERCAEGSCRPGEPVSCDDGVECTADTCDSDTGGCVSLPDHERCARGELCDPARGCVRRACSSSDECDDGFHCNGAEFCEGGYCAPGAPPVCDDGIGCTADRCDEASDSCRAEPDDRLCDDGLFCNGVESCDPAVGCRPGTRVSCDDGDPCTLDSCAEASRSCVFVPRDRDGDGYPDCACAPAPCDCDDDDITVNPGLREQCRDLRDNDCDGLVDCDDPDCEHSPRCATTTCTTDADCDDGLYCNGAERCDPGTGTCVFGPPPCGESGPCETVTCDERSRTCAVRPVDADGDGYSPTYCGGGDCDDSDPRSYPGARELCTGGRDEDCDGRVDCADPDCRADPACCVPTGPENCADGIDNDCDGLVDCSDLDSCALAPECVGCIPEVCWDGRDNDCDRLVDCADPDCAWYPPCSPPPTETDCTNGRDDDFDGLVDCEDPDCDVSPFCPLPDTCTDAVEVTGLSVVTGSTVPLADDYVPDTSMPGCRGGRGPDAVFYLVLAEASLVHMDTFGSAFDTVLYVRATHCASGRQLACNDDTSGLQSVIDFEAEPGYVFIFVDGYGTTSMGTFELHIEVTPLGSEICDNGIDDDRDRLVDCDDPDCAGFPACTSAPERGVAACTDGRDNDLDGLVDCADTEDCAVVDFTGECCNGRDDNRNGVTDEFACACDAASPCDSGVCYAETVGACGPRCSLLGGDLLCGWLFPGTTCSSATGTCVY